MNDGKFEHGGGGGGGGGPAAVAAAAVVAMDNNWGQKQLAMRALTVAWQRAMMIADGGQQGNNQPTTGAANAGH